MNTLPIKIPQLTLRRFNNLISLVILVLAAYIFFLPVVPQAGWWINHSAPLISKPVYTGALPKNVPPVIPEDNRLIIPAINLNQHIYQGQSIYTVDKGVWIRPNGSMPDKGSNTVMVGHRLTYTDPEGVFYFLNKLNPGDGITVYWQGKAYTYTVVYTKVVPPTDVAIEGPTANSQLTLYTCTPLWSLNDRLVVVADLVSST